MKTEELNKILEKISREELNKFLINLLSYDENILNHFRSEFIKYFPKISKSEYQSKVMNAIINAGGKDNYIDYSETWAYSLAMSNFIHESQKLVKNKDYESAFNLVEVILDSIPDTALMILMEVRVILLKSVC